MFDATFYLYNGMHLPLCGRDGFGPPPGWDLALVKLVDFGGGTATQVRVIFKLQATEADLPLSLGKI
jgi:hypothetical protein